MASCSGHSDVVKLLRDTRVEQSFARAPTGPSVEKNKSICFASYKGYTKVVKLLLADNRVEQSFARTPTGP